MCMNTHTGLTGKAYDCRYCVCVKCNGIGKYTKDGATKDCAKPRLFTDS